MDYELIAKLMAACNEHDLPMSTHVQQKEPVKIVFSQNFVKSAEYERICREIGSSPGEFTLKINRPTGPADQKHTFIMSKDIEPEHFLFSVHKLKRNPSALSDCLTDLLETWNKDSSGRLKTHHGINEKMTKGYLKIRDIDHPDTNVKFSHEDIKQSILNYHLWATVSKDNPKVWFQKWDLSAFLRSNKAIPDWCYDKAEMMGKVGEQYFETQVEEQDDIDPEVLDKSRLSHLRDLRETIDRGEKLTPEWQGFWDQYHHLLDGQS